MKISEGLGFFGIYLLLPAVIGALSGYIGIHLLFGLVKAIEEWRGRRVAIVVMGLASGVSAFVLLISPIFLEGYISGLGAGLLGFLTGGMFALGVFKKSKSLAGLTGGLLGLFTGAVANLLIGFLIFRPGPQTESYLLIVPFLSFVTIGGLAGLVSSEINLLAKLR